MFLILREKCLFNREKCIFLREKVLSYERKKPIHYGSKKSIFPLKMLLVLVYIGNDQKEKNLNINIK